MLTGASPGAKVPLPPQEPLCNLLRWALVLDSPASPSFLPGALSNFCRLGLLLTAAAAKSFQLCPTLCDPRDSSPSGSPVPGILQARTLKWVAISFSNAWKWKVKVKSLSRVRLLATSWTAAYQAPPSMGFSRQVTPIVWNKHCWLPLLLYLTLPCSWINDHASTMSTSFPYTNNPPNCNLGSSPDWA